MSLQTPDPNTPETVSQESPEQESRDQSEWFYTQRGETYGPVSSTELRAAAHLGFLGPNDLVCRKDRGMWIVASKIHGLFKKAH